MAEITAAMVKQLRDRTSLPMMDCKKALQEADGDMAKAEQALRRSGALAAAKKAGRETAEGRVACFVDPTGCSAGIVEMRCETAPVANTDDFIQLCNSIAQHVATCDSLAGSVEELLAQCVAQDSSKTVEQLIHETVAKIRENMQIARFARITDAACVASYVHHNGQVAVLVQLDCPAGLGDNEQVRNLGRDLCMQVAAAQPMAVDRDSMPADVVEHEKAIVRDLVQQQAKNKPEHIVEKILQGKMNKWFNERVLLEQPFVKEDKRTVEEVINQVSKTVGQPVKVVKFIRYEVGGQA